MGHTFAISVEYLFRVTLPSIPRANRFERGTTHGRARVRVAVQVLEPFGDGAGVSNWNDEAVLSVGDHIRAARVRGCNHRNPAGHRLNEDLAVYVFYGCKYKRRRLTD